MIASDELPERSRIKATTEQSTWTANRINQKFMLLSVHPIIRDSGSVSH
jgi:hypothetical protein